MKNILYTVAKTANGDLIQASQAEKGHPFYCPVCNSELLLRKSGNIGKNSKRAHFAHKALTANCTPETALHFSFKMLLAEKLQRLIKEKLPLQFQWDCKYCDERHQGNLLKKIKAIRVEHDLGICRPDITLFDGEKAAFAVVEIVVTHRPENRVLDYYQENNIILIQINLTSDTDINELDNKISNPNFVSTCFNPKCEKCGKFKHRTLLTVIDGTCWKCSAEMKVAAIQKAGSTVGPSGFSLEEINIATSKGVNIKEQYSKTINENYMANTCRCGAFIGDHYIFTDYVAPASYGDLPSKEYEIGYHCEHCFQEEDTLDEYDTLIP